MPRLLPFIGAGLGVAPAYNKEDGEHSGPGEEYTIAIQESEGREDG